MKNIFKLFAVVAMGLFATSCATDLTDDLAVGGGDVTVSFTAGVPTRAISDGTQATDLYVTVYAHRGSEYLKVTEKTAELVNLSATVNLDFVQGGTYTIIFWAQNEDCGYTLNWGNNDATVDMNYDGVANAENKDAFYAVKTLTINGPANHPVTLTRPFAQLNVGTSDLAKAQLLNFELASVVVEAQAYGTLNLLTGEASNKQYVSFAYTSTNGELPEQDGLSSSYQWLSYNYILVGSQDETLDSVKATIAQKYGNAREITEYNVPVKRNYRTNLVGALLTTQNGFNVELAPGMEGESQSILVNSAEGLQAAIDAAGSTPTTIVLSDDITLGAGIVLGNTASTASVMSRASVQQDITINLNGVTVTAEIPDVTANTAIFNVGKGQKLTLEGEGTVNCIFHKATGVVALVNNEAGEVVINGGTYTLSAPASWQECLAPLFVDTNSTSGATTTTINGGSFTWTRNLFRNFSNNSSVVAKLVINGGTFNGAADDAGCIWNQKPNASLPAGAGVVEVYGGEFNNLVICSGWTFAESVVFDAAGYALGAETEDDGEWNAPIVNATANVSTWDELVAAAAYATLINLKADITAADNACLALSNTANLVLDLNGHALVGSSSKDEHFAFITNDGALTINDSVGGGKISYDYNGASSNWGMQLGNYTILNRNQLTINAGTIENISEVLAHMIDAIDNHAYGNPSLLTINGGTIACPKYVAIRQFVATEGVENKVVCNNGTIIGSSTAFQIQNMKSGGVLDINKGELTGDIYISEAKDNYEISVENATMYVKNYKRFKGALAFANESCKVILTDDIAVDADTTVEIASGKTINLDLNGKTLSSTNTRTATHNDFILLKGTLNAENGVITYEHTGTNMGWNGCTNLLDITAGGVANLKDVVLNNIGGTDMNFAAHLNNWGEVTLNADNCEFLATYCGVRLFNSGYDMNNVSIANSKFTGGSRAFWVHNYIGDLDSSKHSDEAIKARLNLNIFGSQNNTYAITGNAVSPIRYGFNIDVFIDPVTGNPIE